MIVLAIASLLCAGIPAAIFCVNLRAYRAPGPVPQGELPRVSVLVPARNEEPSIAAAVQAALASTAIYLEVIVMDDSSTDRTAEIVRDLAATNPTVHLEQAPPLPAGWNGKQHACWSLANAAQHDLLCFVDADVQLAPEAVARMAGFLATTQSQLVSGFPRQITITWLEQLLLPLIHFILLGYLPVAQMRRSPQPGYGVGCGQFLLVERAAYFASGGHAAIRHTMHDGIKLPRLLRAHGFCTDLADLTAFAHCRMYRNAREVWLGLAKNAGEGMGSDVAIAPATLLLCLGQVVPVVLLFLLGTRRLSPGASVCAVTATLAASLPRLLAVRRFRQPLWSALLHPFGILALVAVQWYALIRRLTGMQVTWKTRAYTPGAERLP